MVKIIGTPKNILKLVMEDKVDYEIDYFVEFGANFVILEFGQVKCFVEEILAFADNMMLLGISKL